MFSTKIAFGTGLGRSTTLRPRQKLIFHYELYSVEVSRIDPEQLFEDYYGTPATRSDCPPWR